MTTASPGGTTTRRCRPLHAFRRGGEHFGALARLLVRRRSFERDDASLGVDVDLDGRQARVGGQCGLDRSRDAGIVQCAGRAVADLGAVSGRCRGAFSQALHALLDGLLRRTHGRVEPLADAALVVEARHRQRPDTGAQNAGGQDSRKAAPRRAKSAGAQRAGVQVRSRGHRRDDGLRRRRRLDRGVCVLVHQVSLTAWRPWMGDESSLRHHAHRPCRTCAATLVGWRRAVRRRKYRRSRGRTPQRRTSRWAAVEQTPSQR